MARVLIVDDSLTVRQQVGLALMPLQVEYLTASDGLVGWSMVREDPDIDLMIIDLNMPGLNGFELMKKVRDLRGPDSPTILVLTTASGRDLVDRARSLGANGWITKPAKSETLLIWVRNLLDWRNQPSKIVNKLTSGVPE